MTASPTLPGVLVRTIAPLLSTAPNMSACVIPADVIPSVIETNLIAFIDSKEGRWRTVFPSALHRKRRSSEIRLAGIRRGFGCSCHSTAPAAVSGVPWKRPVWPREPERRFRVVLSRPRQPEVGHEASFVRSRLGRSDDRSAQQTAIQYADDIWASYG
jgi:hypothetical protein